jgi:cytoskeletal protein CcmA (bactofilin family)
MSMFTSRDSKPADTAPKPQTQAPSAEPVRATAEPIAPAAKPVVEPAPYSASRPANGPMGVSVISKALKITGQLESTEDIQIDGEIDGDVRAASVKVGANAKVKGTVYGETVELAGTVDGKIEARKVILTSSAHMSGDVLHEDISIQSGAYIHGNLRPEYGKTGTAKAEKTNGKA